MGSGPKEANAGPRWCFRQDANVGSVPAAFLRYYVRYVSARKHPHSAPESACHSLVSGGSRVMGVEVFANLSFTAKRLPEFSPPAGVFLPALVALRD